MEDVAEPAQDLRAGRLPPEQRGPASCERQPVRHVHHPLSQGGDQANTGWDYYSNICPPGSQLYGGHINGGQRSHPGHSKYKGHDF